MTALLEIDRLLDDLEAGLRKKLEERGVTSPALIGIRTGGVWLADVLSKRLGLQEPWGELDISFYRDDFSRIGLNPKVKPSSLPFSTEDRDIILIDDVIMSGRTIRAAMNEIFDYGRPASIILATLVDLGARELPVQPDVTGRVLALQSHQRVKLRGPDPLHIELQETGH
ncbi:MULTISPECIES: bifunctional pyr operon transcriptional regulator/uracil phosphoribosyltransferase PyrR [unclassified Marinobacter]|jgi:pyrimidine operon attenuation protein / uracil phosphoribosyltransferase|uniref:bifunctional pyr operon transcriptional regulator/uracil phosphoribosyltransferase PyrR n=1 Tax=unclassified Marinobacter TaxID=83889 RepID=UPI000C0DF318|nr:MULTISPECIES: bifunctional pyr operon transcriptional regulator/uracil phosphoribosyltransferase PyrR [unclassified Marinobacter]MAB53378.1 bifunctional pyr operon transcriptional regulator/uracil phosphoribosyltransferase [Marinobacter sp.]MBE96782.1 bifunctional pyr operon transcriptional regulator/uracil phosphoribosyltransferase [Marinobacter sp.]MBE97417.1 bifunctional pyr operon transcriptional regulator/uracil phosphoribosyltransferase [Marinobacter sp.]PHQ74680.1 MAG: bifunctional py|tara:strand:- start:680 stop:1189 length:510 start_codon:yes stop_codon:yes gene_type:complete